MIPNSGKLAVLMSKYDVKQKMKNKWKQDRYMALDYYKGDTTSYTSNYFSETTLSKVVTGNINITRRIIDRISLVYMTPPIRRYTREDVTDFFMHKDLKLQRLERMCNLLDAVLVKPCWRIGDNGGHIEYDIITDYEPIFEDDPLNPVAIIYPIAKKDTVLDDTPELYAYWDSESHFTFDNNGKTYTTDDNPDMINPYGRLPFVECFRDGKPEFSYLDTNAFNGSGIDPDTMQVGQDKINFLGVDGSISIVSPPNAIPALDESIQSSYKMLSQNYHLPISFVEGSTASSGVALKMRNIELTDERKSDVTRWRNTEMELFELERLIIAVEVGQDAGDLEDVDFSESVEILSDKEQREKWDWELANGLIDLADIMMQRNPDLTREEAEDHLFDRKSVEMEDYEEAETPENTLLQALAKPVE
jgi:hypothetical protein